MRARQSLELRATETFRTREQRAREVGSREVLRRGLRGPCMIVRSHLTLLAALRFEGGMLENEVLRVRAIGTR